MLKRILKFTLMMSCSIQCIEAQSSSNQLFTVVSNGTSLSITTNTSHVYSNAGIKINSALHSLTNASTECRFSKSGYCLFSVSQNTPAVIQITGPTDVGSITLCLNGIGLLSCEEHEISFSSIPTQVAYISNGFGSSSGDFNTVSKCMLGAGGALQACSTSAALFNNPMDIAINSKRTYAYIANAFGNNMTKCALSTSGNLTQCVALPQQFYRPFAILLHTETLAYVANFDGNYISKCVIDSQGNFMSCVASGMETAGPTGIAINPTDTYAYVSNYLTDNISKCTIDAYKDFVTCVPTGTGMSSPSDIALNRVGTHAYVSNFSTNDISLCTVGQNGDLTNCSITASGFSGPQKITLNSSGTQAYISNSTGNNVSVCNVTGTGALTSCITSGLGLSWPAGIVLIQ